MKKLFIDKYRPQTFKDILFNHNIAKQLIACAKSDDIPHMIIHGPNGSGRKTFAHLYVKEKYNRPNILMRKQKMDIKYASKNIEFNLIYSNYHHLIDPSTYGVYDRIITQGFFKNILQFPPIAGIKYRIIIVENADRLTHEAQQSLRRTLEKYVDTCRFIFLINQESILIDPLLSRCVQFRLSAPTKQTILNTLKNIANEENIKFINERLWDICKYSQRDINLAINTLQHISLYNPSCLTQKRPIEFRLFFDKDIYFDDIVELLWSSKKQKDLMVISEIREKLYDLLVHCIEPIDILKSLFHKSVEKFTQNKFDEQCLYKLTEYLVKYEDTMKQCSKPIYHLEGFIVSVFRLIHLGP